MIQTPAHAWMLPQLTDLLARAKTAGIPQEVAIAILIDLIEGPEFNPSRNAAPGC
jgi:hypothetical protein